MKFTLTAAVTIFFALPAQAQDAVYTMTNQSASNEILMYVRNRSLGFELFSTISTGGTGTGGTLGSQNPFIITQDEGTMLVTNPGSNSVTVMDMIFGVNPAPVQMLPSGGDRPISVANMGNQVFVLNQGSPANLTGFTLGDDGKLTQTPGAVYALSTADANPGQVQFSPDGLSLVVSERANNALSVFPVLGGGQLGAMTTVPTPGDFPFGFDFVGDRLVVSEASPATVNSSSVSSFVLDSAQNTLTLVSSNLPTTQDQACWIEITANGRYAYAANTPSMSISGFEVMGDGSLRPLTPSSIVGSTQGLGGPRDIIMQGSVLFGLLSNTGTISAMRVNANGSLSQPITFGDFAPGAAGILSL